MIASVLSVLVSLALPFVAVAQDGVCLDIYGTPYREGEDAVKGNSWMRCWGGVLSLAGCLESGGNRVPLGESRKSGGYRLTCKEVSPLVGHMTPTACIRNGQVLTAGQSVSTDFYVYTCRDLRDLGVALEITACIDDQGRTVAPGEQVVKGDYQYQCNFANGYISLRPSGCIFDGVSYPAGTTFDGDKFYYTCEIQGNQIIRRIDGCLDRNGRKIRPGESFHKNGFVMTCEQRYNGIGTRVTGCSQELSNGQIIDHPVGSNWVEGTAPFEYKVHCRTCSDGRTVMRSLSKCKIGGKSGTAFKSFHQVAKSGFGEELDPGCMRPNGATLACCGTTEGGGVKLHLDAYTPENVEKRRSLGYRLC